MEKKQIIALYGDLEIAKNKGYVPMDFSATLGIEYKPKVLTKCKCCKTDIVVLKPHYTVLSGSGKLTVCMVCGNIIEEHQISKKAKTIKINRKEIY